MESILNYICENAAYAPFIIFGLLLLTGINVPISEDILIISAGVLVSTCIPDHMFLMLFLVYAGSTIAGWEAYGIGHHFGPKLYQIRWFKHFITPERIAKLHYYYEKFGILSFMVIRFTPGGFRNGFAMTCGLSHMTFPSFALRDGFAAIFSVNTLFFLGHFFGSNSDVLFHYVMKYNEMVLEILIALIIIIFTVLWIRTRNKAST